MDTMCSDKETRLRQAYVAHLLRQLIRRDIDAIAARKTLASLLFALGTIAALLVWGGVVSPGTTLLFIAVCIGAGGWEWYLAKTHKAEVICNCCDSTPSVLGAWQCKRYAVRQKPNVHSFSNGIGFIIEPCVHCGMPASTLVCSACGKPILFDPALEGDGHAGSNVFCLPWTLRPEDERSDGR